jgi:putative transposase
MTATLLELRDELGERLACQSLGLSRSTEQRRKKPHEPHEAHEPKERAAREAPEWALTQEERQQVLDLANSREHTDKTMTEIYHHLLDHDQYLCSPRTMYRILAEHSEIRERRNQLRHPKYKRPELLATAPRQLWSWDITKLRGPSRGVYFQLYVIIDVFSRFVVGWLLASRESEDLAQLLHEEAYRREGILPGQLTLHSDRGPAMKALSVGDKLAQLGVTKSHSRPYVSDDNPYSESQFKTLKYRPEFPDRFGSIEDARNFCRAFFTWYNDEHYHSGIAWLTPATVHAGRGGEVLARRHTTVLEHYERTPARFFNGRPTMRTLPREVWINAPEPVGSVDGARQ